MEKYMIELEREKTYLAAYLPDNLAMAKSELISDVYVPETAVHSVLRLRHKGDSYCITKKQPVEGTDSSRQNEHTIQLSKEEYEALAKCSSKSFTKRRYFYEIDGHEAEIDVYLEKLAGLVVIDFEFTNDEDLQNFQQPDIALADVTQDALIAGGMLAGRTYEDIRSGLEAYNYKPLEVKG
jgi:CYTH domain-containing protein